MANNIKFTSEFGTYEVDNVATVAELKLAINDIKGRNLQWDEFEISVNDEVVANDFQLRECDRVKAYAKDTKAA